MPITYLFILASFCFSRLSFTQTTIDHINILVPNAHEAAATLSRRGFTIKKTHHYKSGLQKGLSAQSIHLSSGQYIQLMSLLKKDHLGALALWYQSYLKGNNNPQGLNLVVQARNLKQISRRLLNRSIPNKFRELPDYKWLSFKVGTPYQHLSFIDPKKIIKRDNTLLTHRNKTRGIEKVVLRAQGDASIWASILNAAQAKTIGLEFSTLNYRSSGFIQKIVLSSKFKPCPKSFNLGSVLFTFSCPSQKTIVVKNVK